MTVVSGVSGLWQQGKERQGASVRGGGWRRQWQRLIFVRNIVQTTRERSGRLHAVNIEQMFEWYHVSHG